MNPTLIAPEYELFPNRRRWTVEECYALAAEGKLVGRYEILDGEVVSKMGQNPPHAMTLTLLISVMVHRFGPDFLRIQVPIALNRPDNVYSEPEPDIAITRDPAKRYAGRHPGPADLAIVIEVSDSTLRTDSIVKARVYARSGIPEYWIVDLSARQVIVHREPFEGVYAHVSAHGESDTVSVSAHPDAPILVSDILPPVSP